MRSTARRQRIQAWALAAALGLAALTGCSTTESSTTADGLTKVKLQLQWFKQGQFAGYLAAVDQGFYKEQGLDVEIIDGGTDIVPQTVLAQGQADYAIAWVPKALASREAGAGITNVAQIFQRSGTKHGSFKAAGINGPGDLRGKKVGNWGYGNEFELFAGMTRAGIDPAKDVTLVQQQFDMNAFLARDIDAAQAMSYNEYAQLLETKNPATGKLYTPEDFTTIDWNDQGVAML
ncbi:ABC transporter substrate-binding protein [Nocardia crassostreae]|uniref:ABC transporter substrate-binding protein n=1 Tax=Nocardia crassostreae TaxID=53428 RepID=UPI000AA7525E|nr:ABC transporter substrate-binding protein [Nocardia crassostreae]